MKKHILLLIYNKWYCYNITDDSENVLTMNMIVNKFHLEDSFYSSQVSEFIKEYHKINDFKNLPNIIDIESYSKQFIQKSKPLENQDKWNLFKLLKERSSLPEGFKINENTIFEYLKAISEFLCIISENASSFEEDRFNEIEVHINKIIYQRQRKGISVDFEIVKSIVQSLEESVYNIKNILQLEYRIFSPENRTIQEEWLEGKGIEINGSIERTFKNFSDFYPASKLFYDLIRNQKNLNISLDILAHRGGNNRTFPCFFGFGTITSRITLREPGLQNIRKENRVIVKPDIGYEFIYIDYSQFEAGILASLSGDKKLIELYNEDIYIDMSKSIFSNEDQRDKAKKMFYRFMYGDTKLTPEIKAYFAKFKTLIAFKAKIEKEAATNKFVGTTLGNYRNIEEKPSLALSHIVQATASLIFKKAIIKVNEEIKEAEFVLPMHDAALYQVKKNGNNIPDIKNNISKIFLNAFAEQCPEIKPRVNESDFYVLKK